MDEEFQFFWWDAYEDPNKFPGVVYLFGKTYDKIKKQYFSCCLIIKNVPRKIYVIPRESVGKAQKEFNELANTLQIQKYEWYVVSKYWVFGKNVDITKKITCGEVTYSARYPKIDTNYSGYEIKDIVGTTMNSLEIFLVSKKLKNGPCWLKVKRFSILQSGERDFPSWCKINVLCEDIESIYVLSESDHFPLMTSFTLNLCVAINIETREKEIVMAVLLLDNKYNFNLSEDKEKFKYEECICLISNPKGSESQEKALDELPKGNNIMHYYSNEYQLLVALIEEIYKLDPDIFIVNDSEFQLNCLLDRCKALNIPDYSKIGRIRHTALLFEKNKNYVLQIISGRPLWDILITIRQLNLKMDDLDIFSISKELQILKDCEIHYTKIKPSECIKYYKSAQQFQILLNTMIKETLLILSIAINLNIITIAHFMTSIAGNIISRSSSIFCIEQVEYLLLHAFHEKDYILPDKHKSNIQFGKSFQGGLIFDPKIGFYDKIVLYMDFTSMYPSIIREFNLCFSTIPNVAYIELEDIKVPEPEVPKGVIPHLMKELMQRRSLINKKLAELNTSSADQIIYESQQKALKLLMNSIIGCFGSAQFRFAARNIAALVAYHSRQVLIKTKLEVEKLNYKVIYGDTDCLMIYTNILSYKSAIDINEKIKETINSHYKALKLNLAAIYRYFLLVKKKNYAGLIMKKLSNGNIELKQDIKGLFIIKKSTCSIARNTGKMILNQLFSNEDIKVRFEKIYDIINNTKQKIIKDKDNLSLFIMFQRLSMNSWEYKNSNQPHVSVAQRLNKKGGRLWLRGDIIPYVICKDDKNKSICQRAFHPSEVENGRNLQIDVDYYLKNHLSTVLAEICDNIEGINNAKLYQILDIENAYSRYIENDYKDEEEELPRTETVKVIPFEFICNNKECKQKIIIRSVNDQTISDNLLSLEFCPNSNCTLPPWKYSGRIQNYLQMAIRNAITKYYDTPLKCINPLCSVDSEIVIPIRNKYIECSQCEGGLLERSYTEQDLYQQLEFYKNIFDLDQNEYKDLIINKPIGLKEAYDRLKNLVKLYLWKSLYTTIDFSEIYEMYDKMEYDVLEDSSLGDKEDYGIDFGESFKKVKTEIRRSDDEEAAEEENQAV